MHNDIFVNMHKKIKKQLLGLYIMTKNYYNENGRHKIELFGFACGITLFLCIVSALFDWSLLSDEKTPLEFLVRFGDIVYPSVFSFSIVLCVQNILTIIHNGGKKHIWNIITLIISTVSFSCHSLIESNIQECPVLYFVILLIVSGVICFLTVLSIKEMFEDGDYNHRLSGRIY